MIIFSVDAGQVPSEVQPLSYSYLNSQLTNQQQAYAAVTRNNMLASHSIKLPRSSCCDERVCLPVRWHTPGATCLNVTKFSVYAINHNTAPWKN